jgi:hypothetical protein
MVSKGAALGQQDRSPVAEAALDEMQWIADPHADDAVAAILGPWPAVRADAPPPRLAASALEAAGDPDAARRLLRIEALNTVIRSWQDNAGVAEWRADASQSAAGLADPLEAYVSVAGELPPWADRGRIARAEQMFMDYGALSVTMLFCASLPECYVVPDLAAVLHATGQLEERAEHRIRTTGAMIFPVMMRGGLTDPRGSGIAQILKVRLIHATVRNLILRSPPTAAIAAMRFAEAAGVSGLIPPLASIQPGDSMHRALYAHGWDLKACAVPNNQEELAYTLLTFSYVFLRAMRRIGNGFTRQEEEDYLHAWNVAGHFLGIRRELMVETMDDASELFARMQARGREQWARRRDPVDPRPSLGGALMGVMESVFPEGAFRKFPVLLTRRLVEPASARDLGLDSRVSWLSRFAFAAIMGTSRGIDAVVRLVFRDFSISRLLTRAIGYRLTCALLMSQTRDLSVPSTLRPGIRALIAKWGVDAKASGRMNALEDRLTTSGDWEALARNPGER